MLTKTEKEKLHCGEGVWSLILIFVNQPFSWDNRKRKGRHLPTILKHGG